MDQYAPSNNALLQRLPREGFNRIASHFEHVELKLGETIYDPGDERSHVYFPTEGIISVIQVLQSGESSEIALIGRQGMAGVTGILGGTTQPNRIVVQAAGHAYKVPVEVVSREVRNGGVFLSLLLLYIQILYTQVSQSAVCNRHHNLQQQLCRWLLLSFDCIDGDRLSMTQELIAGMLGVRREGVTRAASDLQRQQIIEYRRGVIRVVDRRRLEELSCECYGTIRRETDRLLALQKSISG